MYIYLYIFFYIYIYIYIYIYNLYIQRERQREGDYESKKPKSSTVNTFCSNTHLILCLIFFVVDILQAYYNKIVVLHNIHWRTIKLKKNLKKTRLKLSKLLINCYHNPHIGNNLADNANS